MGYEESLDMLIAQATRLRARRAQGNIHHSTELGLAVSNLEAAIIWLKAVVKIRNELDEEED